MTTHIGVRIVSDGGEVCPRKLLKVNPDDSFESALWDARLWGDGLPTREEKRRYKPSVVVGFKDPSEGTANKIELKYNDGIGAIVAMGFKFFVLRVFDTETEDSKGAAATPGSGKAMNGDTPTPGSKSKATETVASNPSPGKKGRPAGPKSAQDAADSTGGSDKSGASSEEESDFECLCGKQYTTSESLKRHQRSCVVTQNDAAQTPYRTGRRVVPPSPSAVSAPAPAPAPTPVTAPAKTVPVSAPPSAPAAISTSDAAEVKWECICGRAYGCKYTLNRHAKQCMEAVTGVKEEEEDEDEEEEEEEEEEAKPKRKSLARSGGVEVEAKGEPAETDEVETCLCGREFASVANLLRHVKFCDAIQSSKDPKAIHLNSLVGRFSHHDGGRLRPWVCPCGVACFCATELYHHWKVCNRGQQDAEPSSPKPDKNGFFVCDCGTKWGTVKQLKTHRRYCAVFKQERGKIDRRRSFSDLSESSSEDRDTKRKREKDNDEASETSAQSNKRVADKKVLDWAGVKDVDKFEMLKLRQAYLNHVECAQRKAQQAGRAAGSATRAKKRQSVKVTSSSSSKSKTAADESEDMDEEFEVEMILLHIGTDKDKKNLKFLIRWKGYTAAEDSWLTYRDCRDLKALDDYCKLHPELSL